MRSEIKELKEKLDVAVPKTELDAKIAEYADKISDLESRLSLSKPKLELDSHRASLERSMRELEEKLAAPIPFKEAETLKEKIKELESKLAQTETALQNAKARTDELEAATKPLVHMRPKSCFQLISRCKPKFLEHRDLI